MESSASETDSETEGKDVRKRLSASAFKSVEGDSKEYVAAFCGLNKNSVLDSELAASIMFEGEITQITMLVIFRLIHPMY